MGMRELGRFQGSKGSKENLLCEANPVEIGIWLPLARCCNLLGHAKKKETTTDERAQDG